MSDPALVVAVRVTEPQRQFLRSPARFSMMAGGFGSGKSFGLALKTIMRCAQNPGLPGMLVASDYSRLSRDVLPTLYELLDTHQIEHRWIPSAVPGTPARSLLIGEDVIDARLIVASADHPDSLKGPSVAHIEIEEVSLLPRNVPGKPEAIWGILVSRLRVPGGTNTIDCSGTPEGAAHWTAELWERPPDDADRVASWLRDYRLIRAASWTNPFNPQDYVQTMVDAMDPTQQKEKIEGIPAAGVKGSAYYEFAPAKHVAPCSFDLYRGPVRIGLDFNVQPMCAVLMQFHNDVFTFFGEVRLQHSNTPMMANALVTRLKALGIRPEEAEVFPDASGKARKTTGTSDFNILRAAGLTRIKSPPANGRVKDRLNAVNGALYHGRVVIDPSCKWLIKDLGLVEVDEHGDIIKKNEELTHQSDAAGYPIVRLRPVRRTSTVSA